MMIPPVYRPSPIKHTTQRSNGNVPLTRDRSQPRKQHDRPGNEKGKQQSPDQHQTEPDKNEFPSDPQLPPSDTKHINVWASGNSVSAVAGWHLI